MSDLLSYICICDHVEDEHAKEGLFKPCKIEGCDCQDFEDFEDFEDDLDDDDDDLDDDDDDLDDDDLDDDD